MEGRLNLLVDGAEPTEAPISADVLRVGARGPLLRGLVSEARDLGALPPHTARMREGVA